MAGFKNLIRSLVPAKVQSLKILQEKRMAMMSLKNKLVNNSFCSNPWIKEPLLLGRMKIQEAILLLLML
jgi:hypothetical protein